MTPYSLDGGSNLAGLSPEAQINRYFTAKRREASRLYETANCRDAMLRVSNYK
ncbi:MAG: hypothetical protein VSS75_031305 [Candidatus Parabeggiatoa sp.]|nr:hypothetical protein [Candidatus Parabeggiatoa sp.]